MITLSIKNLTKPESRVILFGDAKDPALTDSINRIAITGRKVEIQQRPNWDTGLGHCGNHLCSCKEHCKLKVFGITNTGHAIH